MCQVNLQTGNIIKLDLPIGDDILDAIVYPDPAACITSKLVYNNLNKVKSLYFIPQYFLHKHYIQSIAMHSAVANSSILWYPVMESLHNALVFKFKKISF